MQPRHAQYVTILMGLGITAHFASADVIFNLTRPTLSAGPGGSVEFTGTLTNTGMANVFLNGDVSVLPYPMLIVDDSPFFANAPLFLAADGGSYTGPFFDVLVDSSASSGIYTGSFIVQGGPDSLSFDNLATQPFQVTVTSAVPEPRTALLAFSEVAILWWFCRRRAWPQRL